MLTWPRSPNSLGKSPPVTKPPRDIPDPPSGDSLLFARSYYETIEDHRGFGLAEVNMATGPGETANLHPDGFLARSRGTHLVPQMLLDGPERRVRQFHENQVLILTEIPPRRQTILNTWTERRHFYSLCRTCRPADE